MTQEDIDKLEVRVLRARKACDSAFRLLNRVTNDKEFHSIRNTVLEASTDVVRFTSHWGTILWYLNNYHVKRK